MNQRSKVFISYSHKDEAWLERLQIHLKPLTRSHQIEIWDDSRIEAGSLWRQEIGQAVASAFVVVLLISADYLASDFIANDELPPLLKAAGEEGAVILPVILSPCWFSKVESLAQFQGSVAFSVKRAPFAKAFAFYKYEGNIIVRVERCC